MSEEISFRQVESLRDALRVRRLRNSCRDYLTNFRGHISARQQANWYFEQYEPAARASSYRIFLFLSGSRPVGYGALQLLEDGLYVTECVAAEYRGKGLGKVILSRMIEVARSEGRDVVAEIWASNEASIRLHSKAGFVLESTREKSGEDLNLYRLRTAHADAGQ